MVKVLNRDKIQRMIDGVGNGGSGGGASSIDPSMLMGFVDLTSEQTITGQKTFSSQIISTVETGTAPFIVASTTRVRYLNADRLDGYHATGLFTDLSMDSNALSISIGGTTKTLTVGYATKAAQDQNGDNIVSTYLKKTDADTTFVKISFFSRLFQAYNGNTAVNPNDLTTTIDNIKAMFGFWTDFYLSALGSGGASTPSFALASLSDVDVTGVQNGQALVYNATSAKWVPGTGGVDMSAVWSALSAATSEQINYSHLSGAISISNGTITIGSSTITPAVGSFLPLSGGAMTNTNLVTNMNADLLDGLHSSAFLRHYDETSLNANNASQGWHDVQGEISNSAHSNHSTLIYVTNVGTPYQLQIPDYNVLYIYKRWYSEGSWSSWSKISAGYADDAGSADYATSAGTAGSAGYAGYLSVYNKTIWGQIYWNSSGQPQNVSGDLILNGSNLGLYGTPGWSNSCYISGYYSSGYKIGFAVGGTAVVEISSAGVYSTSGVTALSDIRFKNVVERMDIDVKRIAQMSIIKFLWNDRDDVNLHVGCVAQEWEGLLPWTVQEVNGKKSLDYSVAALVSAVAIARKVESHEERIARLERELAKERELMDKDG